MTVALLGRLPVPWLGMREALKRRDFVGLDSSAGFRGTLVVVEQFLGAGRPGVVGGHMRGPLRAGSTGSSFSSPYSWLASESESENDLATLRSAHGLSCKCDISSASWARARSSPVTLISSSNEGSEISPSASSLPSLTCSCWLCIWSSKKLVFVGEGSATGTTVEARGRPDAGCRTSLLGAGLAEDQVPRVWARFVRPMVDRRVLLKLGVKVDAS